MDFTEERKVLKYLKCVLVQKMYPLVNVYIAMKITIFKFGKSTISMGHFQ